MLNSNRRYEVGVSSSFEIFSLHLGVVVIFMRLLSKSMFSDFHESFPKSTFIISRIFSDLKTRCCFIAVVTSTCLWQHGINLWFNAKLCMRRVTKWNRKIRRKSFISWNTANLQIFFRASCTFSMNFKFRVQLIRATYAFADFSNYFRRWIMTIQR